MSKPHYKAKIQDLDARELICKLYAEGTSIHEIIKLYDKKYPNLNYRNIWRVIRDKNLQKTIEQYRQIYLNDPFTVDLAHKKVRLEDLNRERLRIISSIEKDCDKDGLLPKKGWAKYAMLVKRLIEIEIAGRDEIEKKPDFWEQFTKLGPLKDLSTEELRNYDRELTIKLSAYKREGVGLPTDPLAEITDTTRTQTEDKGESA